jgi:hypothetical protein
MTPQETERMNQLCRQIQDEKNPAKFSALIQALNDLLVDKEKRIGNSQTK